MTFISKKTAYYFSHLFIVISVISALHGLMLLWERYKPSQLHELNHVMHAPATTEEVEDSGDPQMLLFPNRELQVPLVHGTVVNERWQLSKEAASYVPVNTGDTEGMIIYGHNYPRILASLDEVGVGEQVDVRSETGVVKRYEVISKTVVDPHDIDSILPTDAANMVIYTCTGFLDSKRLVVKATLVS